MKYILISALLAALALPAHAETREDRAILLGAASYMYVVKCNPSPRADLFSIDALLIVGEATQETTRAKLLEQVNRFEAMISNEGVMAFCDTYRPLVIEYVDKIRAGAPEIVAKWRQQQGVPR